MLTRQRLSPHFVIEEFDCKDGTPANPSRDLIDSLERLRAIQRGRPLYIVSGFRTKRWNDLVGGAPNSEHLRNRAADIPAGYARVAQAQRAGFTGIGHRGGWVVHVDVRRSAAVVFDD